MNGNYGRIDRYDDDRACWPRALAGGGTRCQTALVGGSLHRFRAGLRVAVWWHGARGSSGCARWRGWSRVRRRLARSSAHQPGRAARSAGRSFRGGRARLRSQPRVLSPQACAPGRGCRRSRRGVIRVANLPGSLPAARMPPVAPDAVCGFSRGSWRRRAARAAPSRRPNALTCASARA